MRFPLSRSCCVVVASLLTWSATLPALAGPEALRRAEEPVTGSASQRRPSAADDKFNARSNWRSFALSEAHRNLTGLSHLTSNERNHGDLAALFRARLPHVKAGEPKGIYLGVGPEQNYTMIADSKSAYAVLFDYDPQVNLVHHIHRSAFLNALTPKEYVGFFSPERREQSKRQVLADFERYVRKYQLLEGDGEITRHKEALAEVWDNASQDLWARARMNEAGFEGATGSMARSYLHDAKKYDHVREMYRGDRIKIAFGSLTDPLFFTKVNEVANEIGEPINVIYASNAYDYLDTDRAQLTRTLSALSGDLAREGILLTSSRTFRTARRVGGFELAGTEPTAWAYPHTDLKRFVEQPANSSALGKIGAELR